MRNIFTRIILILVLTNFNTFAKTIGIIQIIEHPALDATRNGIIETLKQTDPDIKIIWRSVQGNMTTATQLSQNFVAQQVDALVTLGTTPTQIAVKVTQDTKIPVFFASVTDPDSAGLVGKSTGISNFVDVDQQLDSIKRILPSLKTLGLIYNPGEANSEKLLELTRKACRQLNITLHCATALKTTDVVMAAKKLVDKVDAIFVNNDNTALAAFPSIIQIADAAKIPVFASDADLIQSGALAVLGPDQYKIGVQTAAIINQVLENNVKVKDIPIGYSDSVDLYINKEKAKFLGIPFSDDALNKRIIS